MSHIRQPARATCFSVGERQRPVAWRRRAVLTTLLIVGGLLGALPRAMAIEEAPYTVVERDGDFELRRYEPFLVAETFVEGNFSDVGNEGFRRLAKYIGGDNRSKQAIAMTAPVSQEAASETVAMTAPVGQQRVDGRWRITFVMPAKYDMETVPVPLDSRIALRQEPARLVAAVRYSGSWRRSRYEQKKAWLESELPMRSLMANGEAVFARYNPPFMPWFLRRNEVLIPVVRADGPTAPLRHDPSALEQ